MTNIDYGRQADILAPEVAKAAHVTICGLGTIGSHAAVELARLGVGSLHLIDGDVVEAHNLPSQAYILSDIDRPKAEALADRIAEVSDHCQVRAEQAMLQGGEFFDDGPVILAVDNMDARKAITELSVAYRPGHTLLIDGRMGGKAWELLALDPSGTATDPQTGTSQLDAYLANHFFAQSEAYEIPCGGRTVSFIGAFTGGLIASYVCRHLVGKPVPPRYLGDLDNFMFQRLKTLAD